MSDYQTVAIPFQLAGNKRVLGRKQIAEQPWLREFVATFRYCFEYDPAMCWYVYSPPEVRREEKS